MKKSIQLLSLLFLLASTSVYAQFLGGQITWQCMSGSGYPASNQGKFRFILTVYQDCYTASGPTTAYDSVQYLRSTAPGFDTIKLFLALGYPKDASPHCSSSQSNPIVCGGTNYQVNSGARKEYVFTTDHFLQNGVQLTGTPPANGWTFYWNGGMCNPADNLVGSQSVRLKSIMYPYYGQNTYPCFDNTPSETQLIKPILCAGNLYQNKLFFSDPELDSVVYETSKLVDTNGQQITAYQSNYSYSNPLPSSTINPSNLPLTLYSYDGFYSFKSFTPGTYPVSFKIKAYRCHVLVAEIYKEEYFTILNCSANNAPEFDSSFSLDQVVPIGQLIQENIKFTDNDTFSDGSHQTVSINAYGSQFGSNFTNSSAGCLNPPCAVINPIPIITDTTSAQTTLNWQISCHHLQTTYGCNATSNEYDFYFIATDNFCPAPSSQLKKIHVKVILPPLCTEVLENGNVRINFFNWGGKGNLVKYKIYRGYGSQTSYLLIDSIQTNTVFNSYLDTIKIAQNTQVYYKIEFSNLNFPLFTATHLLSLQKEVIDSGFVVKYNGFNPLNKAFLERKIGNGNWQILSGIVDTVTDLSQKIKYRVNIENSSIKDSLGNPISCYSVSSIDSFAYKNLSVVGLVSPHIFALNTNNTIIVRYKNNSIDTITNPLFYYGNGTWLCPFEKYNGTIYPGDSIDYIFNNPFKPTFYYSNIFMFLSHPNDMHSYDDSAVEKISFVGIQQSLSSLTKLNIFPNPVNEEINFNFYSLKRQFCEISIFDANGKFLERKEFQFAIGENQIKMDLNFQYKGLLLIEVLTQDDVFWRKVIRE